MESTPTKLHIFASEVTQRVGKVRNCVWLQPNSKHAVGIASVSRATAAHQIEENMTIPESLEFASYVNQNDGDLKGVGGPPISISGLAASAYASLAGDMVDLAPWEGREEMMPGIESALSRPDSLYGGAAIAVKATAVVKVPLRQELVLPQALSDTPKGS